MTTIRRLIFLMLVLATSFALSGCESSKGGTKSKSDQGVIQIVVLRDGTYILDNTRMSTATLRRYLYDVMSDARVRVYDISEGNAEALQQLRILLEQRGIEPQSIEQMPPPS
ncbi:MAG: hypothetical protein ACFBZ8_13145 [Opitutales bacterium]